VKDTFTRQQWVEYTCGVAPLELRAAIEDHLCSCAECRAFSGMLEEVERELTTTVTVLRESVAGLESSGERAYELCRANCRRPPDASY
jgi:predicted anti-sigma-YlaC factor YlaD